MPRIITTVVDTSRHETLWHCYSICSTHAHLKERQVDCVDCTRLHILTIKTAEGYILQQQRRGFPLPEFVISKRGFKCVGFRNFGRVGRVKRQFNPNRVYQYVQFQGFAQWGYICLGQKADYFAKKL